MCPSTFFLSKTTPRFRQNLVTVGDFDKMNSLVNVSFSGNSRFWGMLKILKNVQTSEILALFGYSKEHEIFENVANIVIYILLYL